MHTTLPLAAVLMAATHAQAALATSGFAMGHATNFADSQEMDLIATQNSPCGLSSDVDLHFDLTRCTKVINTHFPRNRGC